MDNSYKKDLIDRYISAYNAFDVEGMLALLSPDIRFENYNENYIKNSRYSVTYN